MRDHWDPKQYERFSDERSRPFFDLLNLVHARTGMSVVDLGCGSGNLTRELHRKLQARRTLGIDSSDAMLADAQTFVEPGLTFEKTDIATFTAPSESIDLIFSNAAIHWLDDHQQLLARLTEFVAPGGQLAVQVPANDDHPTHVIAAEVASGSPYREALGGYVRQFRVLKPEEYSIILNRLRYRQQHVRFQVYAHQLASRDDVIEWVKGTLLTDYQRRMPPEMFERFLHDYRAALLPKLSDERPFFYPFKRILFWGMR